MIRRDLGFTATRKKHPEPDPHEDVADVAQPPQHEPRQVSLLHQPRDATSSVLARSLLGCHGPPRPMRSCV
jgi:hypothetical protein